MAVDVENGGVTIQISADTSYMVEAADRALDHIDRKLEDVRKSAKDGARGMGNAYAEELNGVLRYIDELKSYIKELGNEMKMNAANLKELSSPGMLKSLEGAGAAASGLRALKETFTQLKAGVTEVQTKFNEFIKNEEKLNLNSSQLQKTLSYVQGDFKRVGDTITKLGDDAQAGLRKATDATQELSTQGRSLDGLTAKIKSLATAYLSFRAVKSLVSGIMKETISQEGAERVLAGRVSATGGAAGFSAAALKEQAKALQEVTTYSDQAIMGMQSMMMIFKSVRGDNFTRATQAAMDLSTAIGGSLTQNAMRLGRALEDPVKGMGLLRRAGIVLSASQQQLIKDFMKTGDIAKAQDVILKQVEGTLGGAAKAYRNSLGGALEALRVKWNSLKEMNDREAFGNLTGAVNDLIKALSSREIDDFRKKLGDLVGGAIKSGISATQALAENFDVFKNICIALIGIKLTSWFASVATSVTSLVAGIETCTTALAGFHTIAAGLLNVAGVAAVGLTVNAVLKERAQLAETAAKSYDKMNVSFNKLELKKWDKADLEDKLAGVNAQIKALSKKRGSVEKETIDDSLRYATDAGVMAGSTDYSQYEAKNGALKTKNDVADVEGQIKALQYQKRVLEKAMVGDFSEFKFSGKEEIIKPLPLVPEEYATGKGRRSSSHAGSSKSAIELEMERYSDELKYTKLTDGDLAGKLKATIPVLEEMQSKTKPMSDDWKKITSTLEQYKEAAKKLKEETWAKAAWDNRNGFLGDLEYYEKLREELGNLAQGSEEWKKRFSELSHIADRLIDKEYEKIYKEFEDGKLTLDEYKQKLEEIAALYGQDLPEVKRKALEDSNKMVEREKKNIYDIKSFTQSWISDLREGIVDVIMDFDSLGDTLQNLGKQLEKMVLQLWLFGQDGKSGLLGGAMGWLGDKMLKGFGAIVGSKNGNIFDQRGLVAFANGGIVNKPTLFPFANGTGLMGEAGPEAIMPLHRDGQGRLGVAIAAGAQSGGESVTYAPVINVNVENNGSGEMSEDQANAMSAQVREVVDARIADQLYEYKRRGFFRASGAYA